MERWDFIWYGSQEQKVNRGETMKTKTIAQNSTKVLQRAMNDVVNDDIVVMDTPQKKVLVRSDNDLQGLPKYPAGTIAYVAGGGQAWQLAADGEWKPIQNPTINVIGDAAISISGNTLVITTPD